MTDDLPPLETGLPVASQAPEPAGFLESAAAAWEADTVRTDVGDYSQGLRRTLTMQMYGLLSPQGQSRVQQRNQGIDPMVRDHVYLEDFVMQEFATERPPVGDFPTTREAFTARIDAERMRELNDADEVLARGSGVGAFVGGMARAVVDPVNIALMPFGLGGGAARVIASEMVLGAAGEALSLPREYRVAEELGLEPPDPLARIGIGAAAGGVLGGGAYWLGRQLFGPPERAAERAAYPPGQPATQVQAAIDRAEGYMRDDLTPDEVLGTAPQPQGLPPIPPDAPADWEQIRNGIFAGESGGDYDALFGYSNRQGRPFQGVRLTELTVDEAIEFADPSGQYGQWVKGQIGRVATPMGAYQIVGTTLRAAKKGLGLRGDEVMTPELQDRLGIWILRAQGTGAWEGYRGPRSSFDWKDRPTTHTGTARGYTGTGQVSVGDDFRIDVDYKVVDMASLTRASGDLQPRDRSRINSDEWIAATAARLDPALLMPSPNASTGTPIIGPDGIIESGNGRVAAIDRAYAEFPDRGDAYRAQIEAAGFAIPEGVTRPVLVAERRTPLDDVRRQQMVVAAQDSGVAQMTPTEVARTTARAMNPQVLARMNPDLPIDDPTNSEFVTRVMSGLSRSDRNAMMDKTGALNGPGERRLREALFARAWPDDDILSRFTETSPEELRALVEALDKAAPAWAALRADIEAGLVRADMDISPYVLDAMRMIAAAREASARGGPTIAGALEDLLNQIDLITGPVSPLTAALVRQFWKNGRAAPAKQIAEFLKRYAQDARMAGRTGQMFDASGPAEVLRKIDPAAFGDLPDDLGKTRTRAQEPLPQVELPEAGLEEGALSPDVIEADAAAVDDLLSGARPAAPPQPAAPARLVSTDPALDAAFAAYEIEMPDGSKRTAAEVLADLDADAQFDAFIQGCAITRQGAPA